MHLIDYFKFKKPFFPPPLLPPARQLYLYFLFFFLPSVSGSWSTLVLIEAWEWSINISLLVVAIMWQKSVFCQSNNKNVLLHFFLFGLLVCLLYIWPHVIQKTMCWLLERRMALWDMDYELFCCFCLDSLLNWRIRKSFTFY